MISNDGTIMKEKENHTYKHLLERSKHLLLSKQNKGNN
jgi:hypothetical protein